MARSTCRDDRERSFVRLYERHYAEVLAYARRRLDEDAARDVTAETFLVAWRRLEAATRYGLPWLYRTTAMTARNRYRSDYRHSRLVDRLAAIASDASVPDPGETLVQRRLVLEALRSLSQRDCELLLLTAWEQVDVKTAGHIIGCSAGTAAVRLHRARRRLRAVLESGDTREPTEAVEVISWVGR